MNKGTIIAIGIILLGVITGIVVYYFLFDESDTIYVESFDRKYVFNIEVEGVDEIRISVDDHFNESVVWVENSEIFVTENILNHPDYVKTVTKTVSDEVSVNLFLFESYNYHFYIRENVNGTYTLLPCTAQIFNDEVDLIFPFIPYQYLQIDSYTLFSDMDLVEYSSFEDFSGFFSIYDSEYVDIDEQNKTITLVGYNYDDGLIDNEYKVELVFDDLGFTTNIKNVID
jgi:hypothetical protein